jgi:acyl carrier protein
VSRKGIGLSGSTIDRVIDVLPRATGIRPEGPLGAETELVGGGLSLDSVAVVELLVALEREFAIEIAPDDLLKEQALRTIGSLAAFLDACLAGADRC